MATLTTHPPPVQRSLLEARPARSTLDDLLASTWGALRITHAASCVVCGGELAPRFGAGPHPVAARCRSCGTQLS